MCKLYFKNLYVALSFRPKLSKSIPYLRPKQLKNHTLWGRTYLNLRSGFFFFRGKGSSLQCRRYLACERSINVDRVYMPPFWMLNARGLGRVIFCQVILSLGVPFDSLQPSARFRIQDGGRKSRTKDYAALAPHKICLQCTLERERKRKGGRRGPDRRLHIPIWLI